MDQLTSHFTPALGTAYAIAHLMKNSSSSENPGPSDTDQKPGLATVRPFKIAVVFDHESIARSAEVLIRRVGKPPSRFRRNGIIPEVDWDELIGRESRIQSLTLAPAAFGLFMRQVPAKRFEQRIHQHQAPAKIFVRKLL